MSAESILSNLLQEEKHRLGTNSQQKSKLLAAISYIEKLEIENRELRDIRDQFMVGTTDPNLHDLARIAFEAFQSENPEDKRRKWDLDELDAKEGQLLNWLAAAKAMRSRCYKNAASFTRLEKLFQAGVAVKMITPKGPNWSPRREFRFSLNGMYGKSSMDVLEAIQSAIDVLDAANLDRVPE